MKRTASEEIWDLLVHCCFLLDHDRKSEIPASIFTDDGIYDHGSGAVVGREALDAQFADVASPHLDGTAHYLSNFAVQIQGDDRARSRVYFTAWHWTRASADLGPFRPADFATTGTYDDDLRNTAHGWRIARRTYHPLGPGGVGYGQVPEYLAPLLEGFRELGPAPDIRTA